MTGVRILAFSHEAGGAAAISPLCLRALAEGASLLLLASGHALKTFTRTGLTYQAFPDFSEQSLQALCRARWSALPDLILTSASSLS